MTKILLMKAGWTPAVLTTFMIWEVALELGKV